MKKTLLTAILIAATSVLSGCSVAYEAYRCHPRPHVVVGPPVKVVEVVHVPAPPPGHHRRYGRWHH